MSKPLLTIRATITREGKRQVAFETDVDRPRNPTPQAFAKKIDAAFSEVRKAVEEELL